MLPILETPTGKVVLILDANTRNAELENIRYLRIEIKCAYFFKNKNIMLSFCFSIICVIKFPRSYYVQENKAERQILYNFTHKID